MPEQTPAPTAVEPVSPATPRSPAKPAGKRLPGAKLNLPLVPADLGDWWGGSPCDTAATRRRQRAEALLPAKWFYGAATDFRVGMFDRLPDTSGRRQLEGGTRLAAAPGAERPRVSIVTVVYNNPDTLQRCIDSVRAQTAPGIEHIIIDGGSDAPTIDIIRANAAHLAYYVSEPDGGIYSAMNKGIAVAQGDFVCLLNSDDTYDPSFVERTLAEAAKSHGDVIVHTDYYAGDEHLRTQMPNPGILLGHLHICHNTFLVSRRVYERIGPFNEDYRIVSDALWMRRAFLLEEDFFPLNEPLFQLSEAGLSSGQSEVTRKIFIEEMTSSYIRMFPQLDPREAETVYLFRFNPNRVSSLHDIVNRHRNDIELYSSLSHYVQYCLSERNNFVFKKGDLVNLFPSFLLLATELQIDLSVFRVKSRGNRLKTILAAIDDKLANRKVRPKKTILHFVTVFSAPSETFIYDLLLRLNDDPNYDNFLICEYRQLETERPFKNSIEVPWKRLEPVVGSFVYKYICDNLKPDLIVAHFAINEFRWHQRTQELGLDIPTITMCHGIDAFKLRQEGTYKDHVIKYFANRDDTCFTAVSRFLMRELVSNGVPEDRIRLLPNAIDDRFSNHRKSNDFYKRDRTLNILSVGRLIEWKGHIHLLRALAEFRRQCTNDVNLQIIYGNGDDEIEAILQEIEALNLSANVTLVPFVDLAAEPDYFSRFDLFIHPSAYARDGSGRTETFGVAVLEAIAAGLPVISTNAGGLPEVIGSECRFAHIVQHGSSEALAEAMVSVWRDGSAFADNKVYADDRLSEFAISSYLERMSDIIDYVSRPRLKAALFSSSTVAGAGYAALRLHRGLRRTSVSSRLFRAGMNHLDEPGIVVVGHPSGSAKRWRRLFEKPKPGHTIFTINDDHIATADLLRMVDPFDVINLHWHARFLSVENIAALTWTDKPVVMTIRDMMPITGGCHYFHGCDAWKRDCSNCPQIPFDSPEYPASVLALKHATYNFANLTLVALSNHSRDILARAPQFRDCRIEVIPNSIETDVFRPYDRIEARKALGLPLDRKIIGYVPSYTSDVKGYRELAAALELLSVTDPGIDPFVMLVGNAAQAAEAITLDRQSLGYIAENHELARAYSAADIVVVPSLEETFSNTAAEAISCGVPVVGFRTGAIPDLAVDGVTGFTADVGDVPGLARCIARALSGPDMRAACRDHAEKMLSFPTQAHRYEALFEDLVAARAKPGGRP